MAVGQLLIAFVDDPDTGRRLIIPSCPNDRSGTVLPDEDEGDRADIMRVTDLLTGRRGPVRADVKLAKAGKARAAKTTKRLEGQGLRPHGAGAASAGQGRAILL